MTMSLQTFSAVDQYLDAVRPFLEANETRNVLILGIALRLADKPDWSDTPAYMAAVRSTAGDVLLAALMTPPHNLQFSSKPDIPDSVFVDVINNLREHGWQAPGVIAEAALSQRFAKLWTKHTGQPHRQVFSQRLYDLTEVIPPTHLPSGQLRAATMADEEIIVEWRNAFDREAIGEADPERARRDVVRRLASGDNFVWEHGGQPVSMALRTRPTRHSYSIGGVYTPPGLRGRGYASACVAALSQLILDSGKQFCTLFTDLANPTSNSIYQKIGYRPVCDFAVYSFG